MLVGVAGVQILPHISLGSELRVHDLAVVPELRSKGHGSILLKHVEELAASHACSRVLLYSRLTNERAHKFYDQGGYTRYGVEFCKELDTPLLKMKDNP